MILDQAIANKKAEIRSRGFGQSKKPNLDDDDEELKTDTAEEKELESFISE